MKLFEKICKMTQTELKVWLNNRYFGKGFEIIYEEGFLHLIPQENAIPICFIAHMDTVHTEKVKKIVVEKHKEKGTTILSSPQGIGGDDRCGIYMIVKLLDLGYKPYVIFCEDEERGCIGANKFCKTKYINEMDIKFMVELDRRGGNDAVYYDLDNREFEEFVTETTGYETNYGSVSDISYLAPEAGVAAVNLSCGYYKEHTIEHYVIWEEMERTLEATMYLIAAAKVEGTPKFEYKEKKRFGYFGGKYGWYDDPYDDYYVEYVTITWIEDSKLNYEMYDGRSIDECVGKFLVDPPYMRYNDIIVEES